MPHMQRNSSGEIDIMEATTQRIELAKQIDAILEDRDQYDFDEACMAVVGLIQDTTAGAPLTDTLREIAPGVSAKREYDFSEGIRGKYVEKEIVPIESLAPGPCPESPSGKHCGDHRYRVTGLLHELRCCWCKEKIEVKITQLHVITEGHGPSSGYEEDRFAMPEGWEEGP